MGGVPIRLDASALQLRERARLERDARAMRRALAVAMVLEGHSRTVAARSMGMERQALRDAIHRYNAEGWDGFYDRPRPGRPPKLTHEQQAKLKANILDGPPQDSNQSEYRIRHLIEMAKREFNTLYSESGLRTILKRLDLSWMTCRPVSGQMLESAHAARAAFTAAPMWGTGVPFLAAAIIWAPKVHGSRARFRQVSMTLRPAA